MIGPPSPVLFPSQSSSSVSTPVPPESSVLSTASSGGSVAASVVTPALTQTASQSSRQRSQRSQSGPKEPSSLQPPPSASPDRIYVAHLVGFVDFGSLSFQIGADRASFETDRYVQYQHRDIYRPESTPSPFDQLRGWPRLLANVAPSAFVTL